MRTLLLACSVWAAALGTTAAGQQTSCVDCHGSLEALRKAEPSAAKPLDRFVVDSAKLKRSAHKSKSCDDCHMDYGAFPHSKDRTTAGCMDCHDEAAKVFAKSVHGKAAAASRPAGAPSAPPVGCSSCHGVHDVLKPSDRESSLHPLNVHATCTACHADGGSDAPVGSPARFRKYASDVHAHGLIVAGLTVSATCVACHGGHSIHARNDPESPVARQRVDQLCGKCHVVPFEEYRRSIHHLKSAGEKHEGATCTDCHRPHGISQAKDSFLKDSVDACTRCHDERGTSFRLTYHGKVTSLGFDRRVATCNACHSNHAILPASDPASSIHASRLVGTCAECHPGSNEGFAAYPVHADPRKPGKHPGINLIWIAMLCLIGGVMTVGGLHVLLWLGRSLRDREWRLKHAHESHGRHVRRMQKIHVGINVVATASILVLAGTGLPLHFSESAWARRLMELLGGTQSAALLHRAAAIVLMLTFAFFVGHVLVRAFVRRERGLFAGPFSMTPRRKDLQDFAGNVRWFLGLGKKPAFGRWIYWEKFDFWAVFWGMGIMGLTGAMLWFPEAFARWVPAWLLNAAGVIHGLEALLAVAFHFAVQAFQINLRPDKFPLDVGFYTGIVPEEELRTERPEEYRLLVEQGRLEALVTPPPSRGVRMAAAAFGGCTTVLGLLLLVMTALAFF
jgi:predicted CXXCH cytochrome family protein